MVAGGGEIIGIRVGSADESWVFPDSSRPKPESEYSVSSLLVTSLFGKTGEGIWVGVLDDGSRLGFGVGVFLAAGRMVIVD